MARPRDTCRVIVLGSTGSIGRQTLEVIEHLNGLHARGEWPTRFDVVGLAARKSAGLLGEQAAKFGVRQTAVTLLKSVDLEYVEEARTESDGARCARQGEEASERLVREVECDLVVAAMSGSAGLPATLTAVHLGRDVALANKETLVAAGALIVPAARKSGSRLVPVDSEHSAVWQCLCGLAEWNARPPAPPVSLSASVSRVILTASGGPFRAWTKERAYHATPEEALKHPTWSMGPKVTVDSASLMNKALEIIEAHWLFGLPPERIGVLIHPQSVIHAIVELADGSALAQMGAPDMRGPIQFALSFPHRPPGAHRRVCWRELRSLELDEPEADRFPALGLAYRAIRQGGAAGAVLNAANEAAVEMFLNPRGDGKAVPFGAIAEIAAAAMETVGAPPIQSLDDVLRADAAARDFVRECLG